MAAKKDSLTLDILDKVLECNKKERLETHFIETGNIGFDLGFSNGLGLAEGSSALFWADAGIGKTTLVGDICRRLLDKAHNAGTPFRVLYIATENSKELLKDLGLEKYMVSRDFLYLGETQICWRDIEKLYTAAILGTKKGFENIKLIVIDSVNTVLSDANKDKSGADGDFGSKAKERSNFYAKYLPLCSEKGITSFFISQARQKQDAGMYEDSKKAAVSFADRHTVEVIFKCTKKAFRTGDGKVKIKTVNGDYIEERKYILTLNSSATDCKNRFCKGLPSEILMIRGEGADNSYPLRKLLEFNGYIKAKGAWYTFDSEIVQLIKAPENNLRLSAVDDCIKNNMGTLVEFLKERGQYRIDSPEVEYVADEESDVPEVSEEAADE